MAGVEAELVKKLEEQIVELKRQIKCNRALKADATFDDITSSEPNLSNYPNLKVFNTLRGHVAAVITLDWFSDNVTLLSSGRDCKINAWDSSSGHLKYSIQLKHSSALTLSISPSEKFVAYGGTTNEVSLLDLTDEEKRDAGKASNVLQGHLGYISTCKYINDKNLVTGSGDSTCAYWDVETGKKLLSFDGHQGDIMSVSVLPYDPNYFISGACDGSAKMWDIRANREIQSFMGHDGDVNVVQVMSNSMAFATGSDDATSILWDIRAGRELKRFESQDLLTRVYSVAFSVSGRILFSGYDNGTTSSQIHYLFIG